MTFFDDDDPVPPDREADPALLAAFLACSTTIGVAGRMIAGSKTGFREDPRTRDHAAVFNANICIRQGKVWHGDIDLTVDEPQLQQAARELATDLCVLYESDARFQTAARSVGKYEPPARAPAGSDRAAAAPRADAHRPPQGHQELPTCSKAGAKGGTSWRTDVQGLNVGRVAAAEVAAPIREVFVKRLMALLVVALAIPAATAFASISGTGGGTSIANGQATLVSNSTNAYSFISFNDLNGQLVSTLTELSADVVSADAWGGGSPRFSVSVTNGTTTKAIFIYLGDLPNFTSGSLGDTGNLLDPLGGARVDSTQIGGPFYGTLADALAAATASGFTTISNISLVVDGSWLLTSQTVVFDAVSINAVVYDFVAAAKSDCKDGNWQVLGYKNQGACVSFVMTGH